MYAQSSDIAGGKSLKSFVIAALSLCLACVNLNQAAAEKKGRRSVESAPKTLNEAEVLRKLIAKHLARRKNLPGNNGIVREHGIITSAEILGPALSQRTGRLIYCVTVREKISLFQLVAFRSVDVTIPVGIAIDRAKNEISMEGLSSYATCDPGGVPFPELIEARRHVRGQLGLEAGQ
ncbi:hypothetical protein [Chelatococcus reniformis]|uniref:hypothetical protein n=1 Tax=Chelatococcus reniformis TaxID=1494448 RepID=UPI001AEDCB79|nr:hypothetical protein [Chelatococcus reniformis]